MVSLYFMYVLVEGCCKPSYDINVPTMVKLTKSEQTPDLDLLLSEKKKDANEFGLLNLIRV